MSTLQLTSRPLENGNESVGKENGTVELDIEHRLTAVEDWSKSNTRRLDEIEK